MADVKITELTELTTPQDTDVMPVVDNSGTPTTKKSTWANIKATLKTYFDSIYQAALVSGTNIKTINSTSLLGSGNIVIQGSLPIATAAGTVDAITADYTPDISLADKTIVAVVAAGANTSTTPTFAPDGLTAHTITKEGGQALLAGDIPAAGFVMLLEYNLANTRWELLNPSSKVYADTKISKTTAGEIAAMTEKTTPVAADVVVVEDSAASNAKKKVQVGNLPYLIKQAVSTNKTSATTLGTTANAWQDLGLEVTITPTSTSSKVLLLVSLGALYTANGGAIRILRNGSTISGAVADSASNRALGTFRFHTPDGNHTDCAFFAFLDSPASTSALTYKLQVHPEATTVQINRTNTDSDNGNSINVRVTSNIIALEIK